MSDNNSWYYYIGWCPVTSAPIDPKISKCMEISPVKIPDFLEAAPAGVKNNIEKLDYGFRNDGIIIFRFSLKRNQSESYYEKSILRANNAAKYILNTIQEEMGHIHDFHTPYGSKQSDDVFLCIAPVRVADPDTTLETPVDFHELLEIKNLTKLKAISANQKASNHNACLVLRNKFAKLPDRCREAVIIHKKTIGYRDFKKRIILLFISPVLIFFPIIVFIYINSFIFHTFTFEESMGNIFNYIKNIDLKVAWAFVTIYILLAFTVYSWIEVGRRKTKILKLIRHTIGCLYCGQVLTEILSSHYNDKNKNSDLNNAIGSLEKKYEGEIEKVNRYKDVIMLLFASVAASGFIIQQMIH